MQGFRRRRVSVRWAPLERRANEAQLEQTAVVAVALSASARAEVTASCYLWMALEKRLCLRRPPRPLDWLPLPIAVT